ncbi:MAG: cell division protein FtsZ [Chitinophagaceae bacterium]|nr:cell division protein FtsZ [Chitinophagaceae bacterium]
MIHFDLPKQKSSIIKVLGVGGGGSNAVNYMFNENIEGVDFIICNTDAKALEQSRVPNKIQLGPHLTQGLGAGANPEIGKQAVEESLEEIKRILEVNTKMAFICAGMGGGTGTGGAPIISKICRDLGILTVGIVTTPFGFEGPRRHQQAELGIAAIAPYVDTLLVISNDKLRMQYGNLKMKEAFGKADNVLATAAKCITDIINSRGHIIVDFADVCTVMKNGGVAILGSAAVSGEERAQRAIEEALASPLLNDSDIRGAKWILININSAEGEHECTMDELEIINGHLRLQAGEFSDVIVGMGYDNTLNDKIGITVIATGFDHKDPFKQASPAKKQAEIKPEKIVMTLAVDGEESKIEKPQQQSLTFEEKDPFAPSLSEPSSEENQPAYNEMPMPVQEDNSVIHFELSPEITNTIPVKEPVKETSEPGMKLIERPAESYIKGGFLNKPANVYAQPPANVNATMSGHQPPATSAQLPTAPTKAEEEPVEFSLVFKDEEPVTQQPMASQIDIQDEEEDQKRRAAERIQKLRNLSFNMNSNDPHNNEFEAVPAYIRKNMELFGNTLTSAENFYSKYTVKKDENNDTHISSINTFLDGKKPD